jgi:lia operon protein LiaF
LIIIGVVILLNNFDVEIFRYAWPLLIILVGVFLIYRSQRRSGMSRLSEFRILGDSSHAGRSEEIDGTDISHFIGDTEIDLTGAKLKSGVNKVNIATFIGDIRVMVPEGMAFSADCSAVFADIRLPDRKEGGIFLSARQKSVDYETADSKLYLSCATVIGDIIITRIKPTSASEE